MSKKLSVWSEEEIRFLKENVNDMSYEEMADKITRSPMSVRLKAKRTGLVTKTKPKKKSDYLNFYKIEECKKREYHYGINSQSDKSIGKVTAYEQLAIAIVDVSINDLKKEIRALKRIADRGFKKERLKEAVKKVLISEAAFFNDNFPMYVEANPKEIVRLCWESCKADRNKYLKDNLYLVEEYIGKEFVE